MPCWVCLAKAWFRFVAARLRTQSAWGAQSVDNGRAIMQIAVLTFEGYNELDSFIASAMLNRVKQPALKALIVCPAPQVASMNGVVVHTQAPLAFAREADAVIVGSGV